MADLEEEIANLSISGGESGQEGAAAAPPPPPPMPTSLSSSSLSSRGGGNAPPPPPPGPAAGLMPTYKQQREQNFQEQQMANLPSGLMTTAMKADKKPFSYTPVGLSAADLKSPSMIRQEKLEAASAGDGSGSAIIPGIPRGPTHYRVFNGITPPSPTFGGSASSEATGSSYSPSLRRSNSAANSVASGDEPEVRARPSANTAAGAPIQSRSFRILQWMTGADQDDDASVLPLPVSHAEPDEMRFRGYNQPAAIPSRAFQAVDRMTAASPQPHQQQQNSMYGRPPSPSPYGRQQRTQTPDPEPFRTDLTEEQAANLRYAGSGIPSRSFKVLQNMTDNDMVVSAASTPGGYARQHSSSPALVYNQNPGSGSLFQQNLYGAAPTHQTIAPPSPMDFKYGGPQYSTYELPNPRTAAANSTATPKYSSSVNFTPANNGSGYGQSQQTYGGGASPSPYSFGSPYGYQNAQPQQSRQAPGSIAAYYGSGNVPSRNLQYSQVSTGQNGGHGVSDF